MMDLQPGFRIELVAAEPLVQDPIAFAFDERNRLWVLEWPSYNWPLRDLLPGLEPQPTPPAGSSSCSDTDGDGRMDTRTVFAQMDWPRGIQLVDGGVLVFALPEVVFLRDTDGDDKADSARGGAGRPADSRQPAPGAEQSVMDARQLDVRPAGGRPASPRWRHARAVRSGRLAGQWGMSHDDYGRLFFSYNQDHIRGSLVPDGLRDAQPALHGLGRRRRAHRHGQRGVAARDHAGRQPPRPAARRRAAAGVHGQRGADGLSRRPVPRRVPRQRLRRRVGGAPDSPLGAHRAGRHHHRQERLRRARVPVLARRALPSGLHAPPAPTARSTSPTCIAASSKATSS